MPDIKLLQKNGSIPEGAGLADVIRVLNRGLLRVKATDLVGVFDPTLTVGDGSALILNSEGGAGDAPFLGFYTTGTLRALLGVAQATNDLLTGTAASDLVVRTQGRPIWWTIDSGGTAAASLDSTGLHVTNDVDSTGVKAAIATTSADLTLSAAHYTVLVDASGANRTITLPAAASHNKRVYVVKKVDASANTVTIDGNASETIDGATTKVLTTQWQSVTLQCNGTAWFLS